jgi:hypothetical protein
MEDQSSIGKPSSREFAAGSAHGRASRHSRGMRGCMAMCGKRFIEGAPWCLCAGIGEWARTLRAQ